MCIISYIAKIWYFDRELKNECPVLSTIILSIELPISQYPSEITYPENNEK